MGKNVFKISAARIAASSLFLLFVLYVIVWLLPPGTLNKLASRFIEAPVLTAAAIIAYTAAFVLRAAAWKWFIPVKGLSLRIYVNGLLYSLFLNHVLPIKAGDAVRAGYLAYKSNGAASWLRSLQSVAVLRILDMLFLGAVASIGSLYIGAKLYTGLWQLFAGVILLLVCGLLIVSNKRETLQNFFYPVRSLFTSKRGSLIFLFTMMSWMLESFVLYFTAVILRQELSFLAAWWTTSVTIAGQVFHFSPGGVGTYEAVMTGALRTLQVPMQTAFETAVASHAFKFVYSFGAGLYLALAAPVSIVMLKKWLEKERA
ncbi:lysylphosphatidylglycerol synthase transmembrane domain-containing protein [Fictibacillus iocasae]|uniref:Phosphatidylglycerol lysyltransferase n=1 Tax=Fictibacillus iocasae TaxID=2715437 RepID=A0ABW2NQ27_9BACL